jgi:hypothetical protein
MLCMNSTLGFIKSLGLFLGLAATMAATPATKPAGPASRPAAGTDTSIARNQYHFPAPAASDWSAVKPDPDAESITFLNTDRDGVIQLMLLDKDASVDPGVAGQVAVAIMKQLKERRAKDKTEMVMAPKIEKDKRFAIVIHEKYKVGDATADQLHIYKAVGPRVVMLTVNATAADPDKVAAIQTAAKDMLDAMTFNRKAFKKGQ